MVGNTLTDKDRIGPAQYGHKLTLQSENALTEDSRKHLYRVNLSFVPAFPWSLARIADISPGKHQWKSCQFHPIQPMNQSISDNCWSNSKCRFITAVPFKPIEYGMRGTATATQTLQIQPCSERGTRNTMLKWRQTPSGWILTFFTPLYNPNWTVLCWHGWKYTNWQRWSPRFAFLGNYAVFCFLMSISSTVPQEILSLITYSREEQLDIRATSTYQHTDQEYDFPKADPLFGPPPRTMDRIPEGDQKQWRTRRGRRSGLLVRLRRRARRSALPSILLANVQSLDNEVDNCNILCFTET